MTQTVKESAERIISTRKSVSSDRAILIGISGVDGSGKGYIAAQILDLLLNDGFRAITINIDGWLNLPQIRFHPNNPAQNFYERAIRFDEMFRQLILPLKINRSIDLTSDFTEETATEY